eukprot:6179758-Lingulodinium_polyedra.AAC.1
MVACSSCPAASAPGQAQPRPAAVDALPPGSHCLRGCSVALVVPPSPESTPSAGRLGARPLG